MDAKN
jgi:hypothetical protein